jgi:multiple sugar transport system ATP-binding protein
VKIDAIGAGTVTVSGPDMKAVSVPVATDGLQIGSALTLGTRPHQLLPAEQGAITGTVTLVEHLGNETIVNLRLASGKAVVVGLGGDFQVALGDSLHLNPEVRNAVLFDADGQALPN